LRNVARHGEPPAPIRKRGRNVQLFSFPAKALDKYFLLLHSDFPRHHGRL
jgi:hypothetical protein